MSIVRSEGECKEDRVVARQATDFSGACGKQYKGVNVLLLKKKKKNFRSFKSRNVTVPEGRVIVCYFTFLVMRVSD